MNCAMILAAGRGERMRPLTDHTPKPLLKVGGKPLIVWHIERLAQAGFRRLVINHAHLGQQIENCLGNGSRWAVQIQYSPEQVALETAGGIANALPLITQNGWLDEPFLVVNADVFTKLDFAQVQPPTDKFAHLVMVDNPLQHPKGDFCLIDGILENEGEYTLTFSGVSAYLPRFFAQLEVGKPAKLAPLLKQAMQQRLVSGQHFTGVWHDIGTPERLAQLNHQLTQKK